MRLATLGLAAAGFALGVGAQSFAASLTADAFVAGARPTVDFLAQSSVLAVNASRDARVRAFAKREIEAGNRATDAFAEWAAAARRNTLTDARTRSLDGLGPLQALGGGPYNLSLLLVPPPGARSNIVKVEVLARLGTLDGQAFDTLYLDAQVDELARLTAVYIDFIKNGDDPTLRALAVRELPKVRGLLAEARRLDR